jgi:hypothetical protein
MNVPEDWTTVLVILNVSTLMGVFCADVTMVIPEMECTVMVSSTLEMEEHKLNFDKSWVLR